MKKFKKQKGFSLVEVLLAVALFSILVFVFVKTLLYGQESEMLAGNRARAMFLAEEGVEAVRSMRDVSFGNIPAGTYGLGISGSVWTFSGSSDVTDLFTRSVTIADESATTKTVTSNVSWRQNEQRDEMVTTVSRLTDWKKIRYTEAEQLTIDISNTNVDSADHTKVTGVTLENTGVASTITIAQMQISWTSASGGTNSTGITIDGNSVWTGTNGSGSTEDITDTALALGHGTYPIDFLKFSSDMTGSTITILFTMLDGSTKQTVFTPNAPPDTTAPANITNLATSGATSSSINLSWTAPGNDGNAGTATSYDIRYSTTTITAGNWATAIQVGGEPTPAVAGTNQSMTVSGLSSGTVYYFAIKTSDAVPNISGLSNVATGTTTTLPQGNYLTVNTAGAVLSGNKRSVTGITLQNSGPINIVIASMRVSWSGVNTNRRLTGITINGSSRWTGSANTGVVENITDTTLAVGATVVPITSLAYSNTIPNIVLSITFTLLDGSTKTVSGIGPLP